MDGKQPAFVIGGNIFVSVTPIFVIGYAILEAFNPHRTIAAVVVQRFHLNGETAELVRQTFRTARSGRNTALSLSVGAPRRARPDRALYRFPAAPEEAGRDDGQGSEGARVHGAKTRRGRGWFL
ncbi:MAG TPA: hypothetical protein VMU14_03110, partial [Acidimicrobiales bacterium]|nr:hypothetical protein [Acidimicrobiales bacterium]